MSSQSGNALSHILGRPRIMQIGGMLTRMVGTESNFSRALIQATPKGGGIPEHKDGECIPGTPILGVGLVGTRKVSFEVPGICCIPVHGDYFPKSGVHTTHMHKVEATEYTLSITWHVLKPKGSIGSIVRVDSVELGNTLAEVPDAVQQELVKNREISKALPAQLKDTLAKTQTSKEPIRRGGREIIRTKVDSGACDTVVGLEDALDYPLQESKSSKDGFISASGDAMPNHGQRVLVVKAPSGRLMSLAAQVVPCIGSLTSVAKLIDAGHFVGFHKEGSFIMDLSTENSTK